MDGWRSQNPPCAGEPICSIPPPDPGPLPAACFFLSPSHLPPVTLSPFHESRSTSNFTVRKGLTSPDTPLCLQHFSARGTLTSIRLWAADGERPARLCGRSLWRRWSVNEVTLLMPAERGVNGGGSHYWLLPGGAHYCD